MCPGSRSLWALDGEGVEVQPGGRGDIRPPGNFLRLSEGISVAASSSPPSSLLSVP